MRGKKKPPHLLSRRAGRPFSLGVDSFWYRSRHTASVIDGLQTYNTDSLFRHGPQNKVGAIPLFHYSTSNSILKFSIETAFAPHIYRRWGSLVWQSGMLRVDTNAERRKPFDLRRPLGGVL
jgi:hypothetical protein